MHSTGDVKEEQMSIGVLCSSTPNRVSFNEHHLITEFHEAVGSPDTESVFDAMNQRSLSISSCRFINSGGAAIAATFVLPGNAEYSVSTSCKASPVNEPAENP